MTINSIMERWKSYFMKLLDSRKTDTPRRSDSDECRLSWDNKTENTITEGQLDWAIKNVGKAVGDDRIVPEMIKLTGQNAKDLMLSIIRESYKYRIIPKVGNWL